MNKKILFLNGAPQSGKDTVANYIVNNYKYQTLAFKDFVYQDVSDYFNITLDQYMSIYNNRDTKEKSSDILQGFTPRTAMQYVVETINKPKYGKDYLANKLIDKVITDSYNYVISDLGLDEEENTIIKRLAEYNYKIVYINRDGFDFTNDTRSKRNKIDYIINNTSLEKLYSDVDIIIKEL